MESLNPHIETNHWNKFTQYKWELLTTLEWSSEWSFYYRIAYPDSFTSEEVKGFLEEVRSSILADQPWGQLLELDIDVVLKNSPGRDMLNAVRENLDKPVENVILKWFSESQVFTPNRLQMLPTQEQLSFALKNMNDTEFWSLGHFLKCLRELDSSWQDAWNESQKPLSVTGYQRLYVFAPLSFHRSLLKANYFQGHSNGDYNYRDRRSPGGFILDGVFNIYDKWRIN